MNTRNPDRMVPYTFEKANAIHDGPSLAMLYRIGQQNWNSEPNVAVLIITMPSDEKRVFSALSKYDVAHSERRVLQEAMDFLESDIKHDSKDETLKNFRLLSYKSAKLYTERAPCNYPPKSALQRQGQKMSCHDLLRCCLRSTPASAGLRDANGDFPISHSPSVTALDCPPVADSFGRPASAASDDAAPTNGSTAIQPGCFARQAPPSSGFSSSVTSSDEISFSFNAPEPNVTKDHHGHSLYDGIKRELPACRQWMTQGNAPLAQSAISAEPDSKRLRTDDASPSDVLSVSANPAAFGPNLSLYGANFDDRIFDDFDPNAFSVTAHSGLIETFASPPNSSSIFAEPAALEMPTATMAVIAGSQNQSNNGPGAPDAAASSSLGEVDYRPSSSSTIQVNPVLFDNLPLTSIPLPQLPYSASSGPPIPTYAMRHPLSCSNSMPAASIPQSPDHPSSTVNQSVAFPGQAIPLDQQFPLSSSQSDVSPSAQPQSLDASMPTLPQSDQAPKDADESRSAFSPGHR